MYDLIHLAKRYRGHWAVDDLCAQIPSQKITVILGASGAGKSTLLRLLAGVEQPDSGSIRCGSSDVTNTPPWRRQVALVTQDCALYPGRSIRQSMRLAMRSAGVAASERELLIDRTLEQCGLCGVDHCLPHELSGGQLQRAALAKALVRKPSLLLLDEPFSQVDGVTKGPLLQLVEDTHHAHRNTVILVSHDPNDAMRLADHLLVMKQGKVIDGGSPSQLYWSPRTRESGSLLGILGMNWIPIDLLSDVPRLARNAGDARFVGFRPEHFIVGKTGEENRSADAHAAICLPSTLPAGNPRYRSQEEEHGIASGDGGALQIRGTCLERRDIGAHQLVRIEFCGEHLWVLADPEQEIDDPVLGWVPAERLVWVKE